MPRIFKGNSKTKSGRSSAATLNPSMTSPTQPQLLSFDSNMTAWPRLNSASSPDANDLSGASPPPSPHPPGDDEDDEFNDPEWEKKLASMPLPPPPSPNISHLHAHHDARTQMDETVQEPPLKRAHVSFSTDTKGPSLNYKKKIKSPPAKRMDLNFEDDVLREEELLSPLPPTPPTQLTQFTQINHKSTQTNQLTQRNKPTQTNQPTQPTQSHSKLFKINSKESNIDFTTRLDFATVKQSFDVCQLPIMFDGSIMKVLYPTNSKLALTGLNYGVSVAKHGIFFECFEFDEKKESHWKDFYVTMNIVDEAVKSITERSLIDLSYTNVVITSRNVSIHLLHSLMYMLILTILFNFNVIRKKLLRGQNVKHPKTNKTTVTLQN
jgi:hypothetical protein